MEEVEKQRREGERNGNGQNYPLATIHWHRKSLMNYTHCRTNKGRIGVWKHLLDPWFDPVCRMCEVDPETGNHIALTCLEGEWSGRRWNS